MRSIEELIELDDPRWPDVLAWVSEATNDVKVFPPAESLRREALYAIQVTTRSPMGAIIYESGGMIVDRGWLRILGGGCPEFSRSLPQWNRDCGTLTDESPPPFLLVADDAVGGFFAINGGALGADTGNIYYFAPDALEWESLDIGYTDFILWAFSGDLQSFYEDFRWSDWVAEVSELSPDRAVSFYPFLSGEAESLESRHRGTVGVQEAFHLQFEMARQFDDKEP